MTGLALRAPSAYLVTMRLMSKVNPAEGVADFWREFTKPNPYRWPILGASILLTLGLLYPMMKERVYVPPKPPKVTYITTFDPNRTDAEIIASNRANQELQDRRRAAEEARIERRKEIYRTLGRATGLDVDEMERKIAEDEAREKAAEDARRARMLGGSVADAAD